MWHSDRFRPTADMFERVKFKLLHGHGTKNDDITSDVMKQYPLDVQIEVQVEACQKYLKAHIMGSDVII